MQRAIISTGTVFGIPPFVVNLIPALLLLGIWVWYYRRVYSGALPARNFVVIPARAGIQ